MQPQITISALPKTADRYDFQVRVIGPQPGSDLSFPMSITGTTIAIWDTDPGQAAGRLAAGMVRSHGTANAFPAEGYWFDSYNTADTLDETLNRIANLGWRHFAPTAQISLGSELFAAIDALDTGFSRGWGQPFFKSLDVLFERSQALEHLDGDAPDHAHFIFRLCILSAIADRFDFGTDGRTLNNLETWISKHFSANLARELVRPFRMIKSLRRQYPIHEEYETDGAGERRRRAEITQAEEYFGFRSDDTSGNWARLRQQFLDALVRLKAELT